MTADQSEEELFIALGRAANKLWSGLPQEIQHMLFDEAVSFRGEAIKQPLAIFLMAGTPEPRTPSRPRQCWSQTVREARTFVADAEDR
jgi:hypothetical protein